VKDPLGDHALPDHRLGGLAHGYGDGRVVVRRADDQVGLLDDAPLVGDAVVHQGAARRLDDAHALSRLLGRQIAHVRVGDVGVGAQLQQPLGRVEQLDQPRPMRREGMVHRLAAQGGVELLVGLLCARRRHAVWSP